jgi:universal stress protein E
MAKYQNMLVVIDPNQDDQPALRRAVYLHQRIGGRIKAFLPIYDFSYEMTTLLSPDERTAMRQGVISQRSAWIKEQARFYIESGVPLILRWCGTIAPSKPLFRKSSATNTICC